MINNQWVGTVVLAFVMAGHTGQAFDTNSLGRAIEDLSASYPSHYTQGTEFLEALARIKTDAEFQTLQRKALLANPLLDFDRLLVVRRGENKLGLPQNWQGNCALPRKGYTNDIAILSISNGVMNRFFCPSNGVFVGDVDLNFDADKMLFSMPDDKSRWHVWELKADGSGLRKMTPDEPNVDQYDACYLPDDGMVFNSTAVFTGVPCVGGSTTVANLFRMNAEGTGIRRLCFDQEHNWCPTMLEDGRVLYTRWEYTDTPHYFTRLLFTMNPDGTGQNAFYGSNSYWPNSIFYARPIPGEAGKVIGIVSGHHGVPRMGELVLFDSAQGRNEAAGAVQRIPGYGVKVEPVTKDALVDNSWPKFLHPYPLSGNYFLVSCKPSPKAAWGIYLVDVFDNMVLLHEEPGMAMFEPVPFRKSLRPPVIPDRVKLGEKEATVYLNDIYVGPGLKGVPKGTVKRLRVYSYHFAYPGMGGHINIGVDGPWDVRRILGTVPVYEDGSAAFMVPANTPLALQPLDENGQAIQIMRSWFTAMPGERVSCVGCHDKQNASPAARPSLAFRKDPVAIDPWHGPARGFSFPREVQPVLDRYCVGCHPSFSSKQPKTRGFDASYLELHPFVRRPGPESDYHLQKPFEYHASTSELIQLLRQGHHGVRLDNESWDRLITWIDLNVPDHGTWGDHRKVRTGMVEARSAMLKKYAKMDDEPEWIPEIAKPRLAFKKPLREVKTKTRVRDWSFSRDSVKGLPPDLKIELGAGQTLDLALVPAKEPFYMGKVEVMNAQFRLFNPEHDSGFISRSNKDQTSRGISVNGDRQPVVRVTWTEAQAFCRWLSTKTGRTVTLPSEDQWEWACRGGKATPMWYGAVTHDFSNFANLADERLLDLLVRDSPKWLPVVATVNDGATVTADVGTYKPNPFGLYDMHGNAAEWTSSMDPQGNVICRGGSFYDRPYRATATAFRAYHPYQPVFDVGFRVIVKAP
jgi:hypothetical protein